MRGVGKNIVWHMKYISTLLLLGSWLSLSAQYDGKDSLIASRHRPGFMWYNTGWRPAKPENPRKYDRLIVDIHYNTWHSKTPLKTSVAGSIGWSLHTLWDIPLNAGNGFALGCGFSYKHQRIGIQGVVVRDSLNQATRICPDSAQLNGVADKHVFGTHTIAIPLELRFRMKKWRHVKMHIGGYVGYRFQAYSKEWYNHSKLIVKNANFYDATGLIYGVHARIGIRNWAIFADYGLSKQFGNKQSTVLNPFTLGLSISLF